MPPSGVWVYFELLAMNGYRTDTVNICILMEITILESGVETLKVVIGNLYLALANGKA